MARAVWSGSISFGLVNVPVKAFTAVRDHEVRFHQLEKGTGARIHQKKVSAKTGEEVADTDIEMGYEVREGRYVTFQKDELEELRPASTHAVEVSDFVALDEIDPIYYERTYWLAPADDPAKKAYALLLAAMEDRRRVGVGSVVMRNKQYLAAIRPLDGVLALSTMRFSDEVVPQSQVDELPSRRTKPDERAMGLATQIVDSLATEWDPARYRDTYTDELKARIERKAAGEELVAEEAPAQEAKVVDLMAALEASLAAAKQARKGKVAEALADAAHELAEEADESDGAGPAEEPAKKAPAKKAAAKNAPAKRGQAKKAKAPARKSA